MPDTSRRLQPWSRQRALTVLAVWMLVGALLGQVMARYLPMSGDTRCLFGLIGGFWLLVGAVCLTDYVRRRAP